MAPETPRVRFAVVGAGWISQFAAIPAFSKTCNSEVVAIVSGDRDKAQAIRQHYGIADVYDYKEYQEMLRSGSIDAVYLGLPNSLHREYAVKAAEAGVHILCEKPLAHTVHDCELMIAAAERSNVRLMTAYRMHFDPCTVDVLEAIWSGKIGDPRLFTCTFSQRLAAGNHRSSASHWAGPLQDMGCYAVNLARQAFRAEPFEATAIRCSGAEPRFRDVDESVSAILRFPGNRLASFTVGFNAGPLDEYVIAGTEGHIRVSPGFRFTVELGYTLFSKGVTTSRQLPLVDQFAGQIEYFSDCVQRSENPEPDGYDGMADVTILKAIEHSSVTRTAQPIRCRQKSTFISHQSMRAIPASARGPMFNAPGPSS